MAKKTAPVDATMRNVRASQKRDTALTRRVNAVEKQLTKRLDAHDWAIEELLPRFEALLERVAILEEEKKHLQEQVAHIAATAFMTDAMPPLQAR